MIPAAKLPLSPSETLATDSLDLSEPLQRWGIRTALLLATVTLARLAVIATTEIANGEAYYYVWSRFPSWSYYDHPPLVAWLAWLTTQFSHSSFAIRLGPVLCSGLFGFLVYRLAERLFSPRAGFFAVAIVTVLPAFLITSYVLNPEAPLAPLWVLGLLCLERLRQHDEWWRPVVLGAAVGAAFLAKYTGILLIPVVLLYLLASPEARRWLRRPSLYLGGLAALIVALPAVVWNQLRGWPSLTLHFVERRSAFEIGPLIHNAGHVALGQFLAFHPLFFPGLIAALIFAIRRGRSDDRYRFLSLASWPVYLFFLAAMVTVRDAEVHWPMVAYVPVAIAAAGWLDERFDTLSWVFKWYLRLAVALTVAGASLAYAYTHNAMLRRLVPTSIYDPNVEVFNEMDGWDQVASAIKDSASTLGAKTVVASCQYALCAHILTATDDRPPVYCPTLRRTGFDFLGRRAPPADAPVLYVTDDHYHDDPLELMPGRDCQPLRVVAIEGDGRILEHYRLSACLPRGDANE